MVEYHFTRADYMKDAFYAVMVGLAFAALIILDVYKRQEKLGCDGHGHKWRVFPDNRIDFVK